MSRKKLENVGYETRLRDEVAMRLFIEVSVYALNHNLPPELDKFAEVAYNNADAFLAERRKRSGK